MAEQKIDYNAVLADLEERKTKLEAAIESIKVILGGTTDASAPVGSSSKEPQDIRIDTFFGLTNIDAVMKYLKMCREPRSINEIIEALGKGGVKTKYTTLSSQMSKRATKESDLILLGKGKWGLQEWYPGRAFRKKKSISGNGNAEENNQKDKDSVSKKEANEI